MANTPVVTVGAPDDLGLRRVVINDKTAGKVRSPGELQRLLRHAGIAFGHDIHWLGGDSTVWPDRPWRRRTIGTLMAVGLLTTCLMLVKIGIADILNALTYAGRLAGATFLFLALVEMIAAVATLDHWRKRQIKHSGIAVLLGASIALGFSFMMLIVQIGSRVYTRYFPLWIILTVWSVWALWILVRGRAWKGIRNPKRIAIGALVSAFLAITNLAYSQVYVPYVTSPLIQTAAEFRAPSLNREGTSMYLPVHLTVKNSGQVPVYILGSIYWIHGRSAKNLKYKLISSGEFVAPPGRTLNPGEELARDEVVVIKNPDKPSDVDAVKAQAEVYVVRKDRMKLMADYERSKKEAGNLRKEHKDDDPEGPSGEYRRYQSEISNSDEILNVMRGRQRITLWWVPNGSWPYIYADVAPPGERRPFDPNNPAANKEDRQRYGLEKVTGSMAQTPYGELLKKARAQPATE
ncbi:YIP1 family protein [Streptomyces sp. APSN-46.1]|uniref:Yip1 family protein n=1 Tax=Streptomyces sp. APSN-46.1 TaxID=2929049 RepID=UPI001FB55F66|nr:Yip1 family protein [Streptomyces sp. APSN-46.1]MCJ1678807.1 YIP1 family protein [Streptomyces sp. APSN-46.1]